jgi:uncharacterized protein (TIGR02453 family)
MPPPSNPLKKELFQFLVELKFNNERPWFQAQKPRYEAVLKKPLQELSEAFQPRLKRLNPAYDHARVFRIYRDTRFAKDKTPYKTHAAAQFLHRAAGNDVHAPGFYLHLEPGESFMGAGIWAPDADGLRRVRAAIVARPATWAPLSKLTLWGESYARPPKGVDPGHRYITDLKRKHFMSWVEFKDKDVFSADFLSRLEKAAKALNPLVLFLNQALGLK